VVKGRARPLILTGTASPSAPTRVSEGLAAPLERDYGQAMGRTILTGVIVVLLLLLFSATLPLVACYVFARSVLRFRSPSGRPASGGTMPEDSPGLY
jgi:hypothetical protein